MSSLLAIQQSKSITDASLSKVDLVLQADTCVIGSGAGGSIVASSLAARGVDTLIIEEGGYFSNADFTMNEADVYPKLYQESMRRATEDLGIVILQGRAVGGTTVVNWTTSFRTPEDVVQHWRDKHAVRGFQYKDLVPHWDFIEERLAIKAVQPTEINKNNRKLADGCDKLGYKWDPLKRNVYACMQSGYCGMGCPYNAKRSMLVTLIPDAIDAGARLAHRVRIDKLVVNGGEIVAAEGRAIKDGVVGASVRITAKRFILSGGAINSPALLLRSGLNENGRVGLRTFLHPALLSIGDYSEPIEAYYGAPQSVASHHFGHRGEEVGFFLEAAPTHPLLASATLPGFGQVHREMFSRFAHVASHIAITIDGFHDDVQGGRVKLRPSGAPVLEYVVPERLWRTLAFAQERLAELQLASGALRAMTTHEPPLQIKNQDDIALIASQPWRTGSVGLFSAHQMGGCAMGDDPTTSVVRSEDLRHHQIRNLHVIDGSTFPTSLGVNPQESIYGLALLASHRLT